MFHGKGEIEIIEMFVKFQYHVGLEETNLSGALWTIHVNAISSMQETESWKRKKKSFIDVYFGNSDGNQINH